MKFTLISALSLMMILSVSCGSSPEKERQNAIKALGISIPTYSKPEVQVLAEDYALFVKEYADAIRSKDQKAMDNLKEKSNEMQTKLSKMSQTGDMTPEDQKAWSEMTQQLMNKQMNPQ